MNNEQLSDHVWFNEQIAAYLAGGLEGAELSRFETHAAECLKCADVLRQAEAADQSLRALFRDARPAPGLEDRIIARLDETRPSLIFLHPMVRRAAAGVAAALVLGAMGYAGNEAMTNGRLPRSDKSRYVADASNLRQIGTALEIYANENNGTGPRPGTFYDNGTPASPAPAESMAHGLAQRLRGGSNFANKDLSGDRIPTVGNLAVGVPQFTDAIANAKSSGRGEVDRAHDARMADSDGDKPQSGEGKGREAGQNVQYADGHAEVQNLKVYDRNDSLMVPTQALPLEGTHSVLVPNHGTLMAGGQVVATDGPVDQKASGIVNVNTASASVLGALPKLGDVKNETEGFRSHIDGVTLNYRNDASGKAPAAGYYFKPTEQQTKAAEGDQKQVAQATQAGASPAPGSSRIGRGENMNGGVQGHVIEDPTKTAAPQPAPQPAPDTQQIALQRKVIRSGEIEFEVESFNSSYEKVQKIITEESGYISSTASEKLPNGKMKGAIVVRIPPERLDTLVLKLRALGDLKNQKIAAQDVTKQYTDTESELKAARAMEQRLLDMIKNGKGEIKDLLAAEKELGVWRTTIEKLEGEIRYYNNLIGLSTLTITLYEKDIRTPASAAETEIVNTGIEAEDVEQARADATKAIDEAKGRIIQSELKKHDGGQLAATITAEVPPDASGPVIDRLKQLGKVARLEIERKQTAQGDAQAAGSSAPVRVEKKDTRFVISLYNLANVEPRQTVNLNLAAEDVEPVYHTILARIEKAGGRIVTSGLNTARADQTTATINFEVKTAEADAVLNDVRQNGEAMTLTVTENPDTANVTTAKRRFLVQLFSLASVAPRESVQLSVAASDVSAAFNKLSTLTQSLGSRILASQLNEQDRNNITGRLDFVVARKDLPAVEKVLDDAGDAYARQVSRSPDTQNTIDSKVRMSLNLVNVNALPPRETTVLAVEVNDVAKAKSQAESAAQARGGQDYQVRLGHRAERPDHRDPDARRAVEQMRRCHCPDRRAWHGARPPRQLQRPGSRRQIGSRPHRADDLQRRTPRRRRRRDLDHNQDRSGHEH